MISNNYFVAFAIFFKKKGKVVQNTVEGTVFDILDLTLHEKAL